MLKRLSPLLTPDLLHALASMGHGDEIAIVDANFPSASVGKRVIHVAGAGAHEVFAAVLEVLPLDTHASPAAFTMEVVGDATALPEPVADFAAVMADHDLADIEIGHLERQAFYERAREAFAVVRTGELRPYGNILLVKGTVHTAGGAG
ncbi:MAG: RbsD/FucU family protein [Vicinamibacteria bacterium]|jgi:L-fucose mutarotase